MSHANPSSKLPDSYRAQPACSNCASFVERWEFACPPEFYCGFGAPAPHVPITVVPDDVKKYVDMETVYSDRERADVLVWHAWRDGREVTMPCGICDNHKMKAASE